MNGERPSKAPEEWPQTMETSIARLLVEYVAKINAKA
jgi:hypothetical protein